MKPVPTAEASEALICKVRNSRWRAYQRFLKAGIMPRARVVSACLSTLPASRAASALASLEALSAAVVKRMLMTVATIMMAAAARENTAR